MDRQINARPSVYPSVTALDTIATLEASVALQPFPSFSTTDEGA
jgi:hypothetical protein